MKLGLIADIHEDVIRLKESLTILEKQNCDTIICLGDILGFTLPFYKYIKDRNAEECIKIVKDNCSIVVAGNHDLYAARKIPQHSGNFNYPDNWYSLDYDKREKLARNKIWLYEDSELITILCEDSKEYLKSLNEFATAEFSGIKFLFSHFCYPDLTGSTLHFPQKPEHLNQHFKFMSEHNCLMSFSGHGHPESWVKAVPGKMESLTFGSYPLNNKIQWIVCPCVANTTRVNGITVFDTASFQLEVLPLGSPKVII
jgi:predicted phosphodiesterase